MDFDLTHRLLRNLPGGGYDHGYRLPHVFNLLATEERPTFGTHRLPGNIHNLPAATGAHESIRQNVLLSKDSADSIKLLQSC